MNTHSQEVVMAKKGKMLQIWIDYRILGWAAVAVTAALLIFLIVTTITTNSRINSMSKQMTAATAVVCHLLDQERDQPNPLARENRERDITRVKDDIMEFIYNGGYIDQLEVFVEECPRYVEGFDFSTELYR